MVRLVKHLRHLAVIVSVLVASGLSAQAADDISTLIRYVPKSANALIILRVRDLLNTPRAKRERWAEKAEEKFLAGAAAVPPWVDNLVRASHFHPGSSLSSWSVAVVASSRPIDMSLVARRERVDVGILSGKPAVLSPRGCYFVQLDERLLGVMCPAFRQDTVRWMRFVKTNRTPAISSYLSHVATDNQSQIVLALDMEDMLEPQRIRQRLLAAKSLQGKPQTVKALATLLEGLQGIRLHIKVEDKTTAAIWIDFATKVGPEGKYLKPLLLETLNDMGAALDDFEAGQIRIEGKSAVIVAPLSDEGLRRIMTMILTPTPGTHQNSSAPATTRPRTVRIGIPETVKYYRAVERILTDLERANRRAKNYLRTATWHENFARKIDQLPVSGVDPELVKYGNSISSDLRALAASLRGVPLEVNTLQSSVTYNAYYDPPWGYVGWWGGVSGRPATWRVTSNLQAVRAKQSEAIIRGAKQRQQVWKMIEDKRARIRVRMRQKYGDDFK